MQLRRMDEGKTLETPSFPKVNGYLLCSVNVAYLTEEEISHAEIA